MFMLFFPFMSFIHCIVEFYLNNKFYLSSNNCYSCASFILGWNVHVFLGWNGFIGVKRLFWKLCETYRDWGETVFGVKRRAPADAPNSLTGYRGKPRWTPVLGTGVKTPVFPAKNRIQGRGGPKSPGFYRALVVPSDTVQVHDIVGT